MTHGRAVFEMPQAPWNIHTEHDPYSVIYRSWFIELTAECLDLPVLALSSPETSLQQRCFHEDTSQKQWFSRLARIAVMNTHDCGPGQIWLTSTFVNIASIASCEPMSQIIAILHSGKEIIAWYFQPLIVSRGQARRASRLWVNFGRGFNVNYGNRKILTFVSTRVHNVRKSYFTLNISDNAFLKGLLSNWSSRFDLIPFWSA